MRRRILIPTDFSLTSLQVVLAYLEQTDEQQVEIVLTCGVDLGNSITALLSFDKDYYLDKMQGEDFIKGCEVIRSRYKNKLVEIYSDLMISRNSRYIINYLKGNQITDLILSEQYHYSPKGNHVFDLHGRLSDLQKQVGSLVSRLAIPQANKEEQDNLEAIFFRTEIKLGYE